MNFRKLCVHDYEQYKELISSFRQTEFSEEQFYNFVSNLGEISHIWIAEFEGQIIATATILYEQKLIFNFSKTAHIEDVCVLPEFRGKGVGSKIMKKVYEEVTKNGCRKVTLVTSPDTADFYIKNGYEIRGVQLSKLVI